MLPDADLRLLRPIKRVWQSLVTHDTGVNKGLLLHVPDGLKSNPMSPFHTVYRLNPLGQQYWVLLKKSACIYKEQHGRHDQNYFLNRVEHTDVNRKNHLF